MTSNGEHASFLFSGGPDAPERIHYQLPPEVLIKQTLIRGEGTLSSSGALCIDTGQFTGRCPKDKFIVRDAITSFTVDWNEYNQPVAESCFLKLKEKMFRYMTGKKDIWVRDVTACAHPVYRMNIRVINEQPAANLFCYNMFMPPEEEELSRFLPGWEVIHLPGFKADPLSDGTPTERFAIISFLHKMILIGGTAYTGEIKKGIFTVLNYLLPQEHTILSMHCSVNIGKEENEAALFFGLSGTGKTTLSADPHRGLVGDDEHGWTHHSVFNFEGGCYAKVINLSPEKEPAIWGAIGKGALIENTIFREGSTDIDFSSDRITENIRASYPLSSIPDAVIPSLCPGPKHIFFLTCDAFGVLPPVCRLTPEQAMYYFISGYTAKVAGTEAGITEPKATFSACFGAPFLPLHPSVYAGLLGRKLAGSNITVWMVNTGWTGGSYGEGKRIPLPVSRAIVQAVLNDALGYVHFTQEEIFGLWIPNRCPGVDCDLLVPRRTWRDRNAYDEVASRLAGRFQNNFSRYADMVDESIRKAGPQPLSGSKKGTRI